MTLAAPTAQRGDQDRIRRSCIGGGTPLGKLVAVVAWRPGWCNADIAESWCELGIAAALLTPGMARLRLQRGDVVLNRLDVLVSLDGVEPGLAVLESLQRTGIRVINPPAAAIAAHDKLETSKQLAAMGIPQPRTVHITPGAAAAPMPTPLVIKPRFGSWGRDVVLCRTPSAVTAALEWAHHRPWFREQGAIVQAYIPHAVDLRLIVAAGRVIGAIERRPAAGEWRTNFSLGGGRRPVVPPQGAVDMALAAARAVSGDLVGVDLIATPEGHIVLEINASVDFDRLYSLPGRDAYRDAADALDLPMAHPCPESVAITRRRRSQWSAPTGWRAAAWR